MATILQSHVEPSVHDSGAEGENDGGPEFAEVFVIVWLGALVVTLNTKFLGGNISFFQSVCVLGYSGGLRVGSVRRLPVSGRLSASQQEGLGGLSHGLVLLCHRVARSVTLVGTLPDQAFCHEPFSQVFHLCFKGVEIFCLKIYFLRF